jgi:hypothetical protein
MAGTLFRYNKDSVNHLRLSLTNTLDRTKRIADAPDCAGNFVRSVIDGCDGNRPVDNPSNYKFGGTFTTSSGWKFEMEPLHEQKNDADCDVSYRFSINFFEIRGKNFPDAKLGKDGAGLLKELRGCGVVIKWNFEYTPKDVKYQWYASGILPIGTKSCVGSAAMTAGSSTRDDCRGAG